MFILERMVTKDNMSRSDGCIIFEFITVGCIDGSIVVLGVVGNLSAFVSMHKTSLGQVVIFTLKVLSMLDALVLILYFSGMVWAQLFFFLGKEDLIYISYLYVNTYVFPVAVMARTSGTWITVMICHHQYVAVCHPLKGTTNIDYQKTKIHTMIIIVYGIMVSIPRLFEYEFYTIDGEQQVQRRYSSVWHNTIYQTLYKIGIMVVVNKFLPVICMCAFLGFIVHSLKKRKQIAVLPVSANATVIIQNSMIITRMLLAVIIFYITTNIPSMMNDIVNMIDTSDSYCDEFWYRFTIMSNTLTISNSAFNVFAYYPSTGQLKRCCCKDR